MTGDYRDHCADCIHMAPWPERVEQLGHMTEAAPFYPLHACMADGCKVMAVAPAFSPDDEGCIAYGCPSFERGDRKKRYKGVQPWLTQSAPSSQCGTR